MKIRAGAAGLEDEEQNDQADAAEIRPYMHRTILLLVDAHVKTSDTAPAVVSRVLEALVTNVTQVALASFQQIPKFGTGGMLTVRIYSYRSRSTPLSLDCLV